LIRLPRITGKSLRGRPYPHFTFGMKKQLMLGLVLAVSLAFLTPPAFGATTSLTGTVQAITGSTITLEVGKEVWNITLGPTTTVKGEAKVGSVVTVTCNETDAQKKEIDAPTGGG
jgi:hypothetical protein